MRLPVTLICSLWALAPALCAAWMGVKTRPRPSAAVAAPDTAAARSALPVPSARPLGADTVLLNRRVLHFPASIRGRYLGNLEGVRCFNCAPGLVQLNVGDSVTTRAMVLTLRIEAWNEVERPLKDRRMFDMGNQCFYFGFKERDTALVGGDWTEIRVHDVPCYPYVKRDFAGNPPLAEHPPVPPTAPSAAAPSAAAPSVAAPAPAIAETAVPPPAPAAMPPSPAPLPIDVVLEPTVD